MHSVGALILAATPMFLLARADVDFDNDDVPAACRAICQPIADLSRRCDASDSFRDDSPEEDEYERNEDRLQAQCVCTNTSFDVANIAALCSDCIRQNPSSNDDDDDDDDGDDHRDELDDINQLMATCGFAATASYAPSASTAANGITVVASAPTAISQLTTTFSAGAGGAVPPSGTGQSGASAPASSTGQFGATSTSSAGDNSGSNDDNNNTNNDDNNNSNDSNNNNDDGGSFGIRGAVPLAGLSGSAVLYGFGALAAGAAVFVL